MAATGEVKGVEVARGSEDGLRLRIDSAVKLLQPQVMPDLYSVKFVQVTDRRGYPIGEQPRPYALHSLKSGRVEIS